MQSFFPPRESGRRIASGLAYTLLGVLVLAGGAEAQRRVPRGALPVPQASPRAYVANQNVDTVSVIDTGTNAVVATVTVGDAPVRVAVSPNGARAYVANRGSDTLSVLNTSTNMVIASIPVLDAPTSLAVTSDGARVWIGGQNGFVAVVDTNTNTMLTSFAVGAPSPTYAVSSILVAPDGSKVYAAWGDVVVVDTTTNTVVNSIYAGNNVTTMAMTPDGQKIVAGAQFGYGAFSFYGVASILDRASETLSTVVNLWGLPGSIAITPDGARAYVTTPYIWSDTGYGAGYLSSPWVTSLDLANGALGNGFHAGGQAYGLAVTPDGARLFVAVPTAGGVKTISTESNTVLSTIPTSTSAVAVAIGN